MKEEKANARGVGVDDVSTVDTRAAVYNMKARGDAIGNGDLKSNDGGSFESEFMYFSSNPKTIFLPFNHFFSVIVTVISDALAFIMNPSLLTVNWGRTERSESEKTFDNRKSQKLGVL